jgi:hypothetical protein
MSQIRMGRKADQYAARAVICLTLALVIIGIGGFITGPLTVIGVVSVGIGILFALGSIVFFFLYDRASKKYE